ncbi:major facilitator transporter [Caballeronia fortuita]|uniref:Major facilitator transporter n=1 Tax=Caballeronia fortuita TaxID=1777138 RepID=A0A158A6W2_9BURK|nr:MFS transporter [Caballeronia fortuita]SAK53574.1 major facilitator transporter [Caballeronia fortuita]
MLQAAKKPVVNPNWASVFAITFTGILLLASEFLPVAILTPIAADLQITEGHAGQSISIAGLFALFTGLFIAPVIGRADRKRVALYLISLMLASGVVVASASNSAFLMIGRAMIGVAIGGFWALTTAIVIRLVPEDKVPKALALINGGNAIAATVAAPLGSYLSSIIGWRAAFGLIVPLAAIALIWFWRALPSLSSEQQPKSVKDVFGLFKNFRFASGAVAIGLFNTGHFAFFTYLRPFLDVVTNNDPMAVSGMLFTFGFAGIVGSSWISILLKKHLFVALTLLPLTMAALGVGLITVGGAQLYALVLLFGWGMLIVSVQVSWWTWLSRTMAHEAEAAGGLMVAIIQVSITLGAGVGGVLFDAAGYTASFGFAVAMLCASALVASLAARAGVPG